jgi:hypothetical protein
MPQLHFDGYYSSGPEPWENWHAGIRMHGIHFYYTRYYSTGEWLGCYRDRAFEFWPFTESITPQLFADAKRDCAPRISDADPLCTAGTYTIVGDILTKVLAPDWTGGMTWESTYQILDDRLLIRNKDGLTATQLFHPKPLR